jgi:mono/diheme cytochrome c family protein
MKRFKNILKWTGIILLLIIAGLTITVLARQNLTFDGPYPDIRSSKDSAVIAKGKELVFGPAHCADCHSTVNADSLIALGQEVPLSGGYEFKMPIGKIYTRNITPDSATGIGRYTDQEIARALRYGMGADGKAFFDFMPFHNTSDEDLAAIISYLRAQKAVRNEVPENSFNTMGKVIKAFLIKPVGPTGEVPVAVKRDSTEEYGKYLAINVANCSGCHTKRDMMTGAFTGELFAGGLEIDGFITPNLTNDPSGRLYAWDQQQFIKRFREGKKIQHSPMPWNSFKRMSDADLVAIYKFLKTLKPVKTGQELVARQ